MLVPPETLRIIGLEIFGSIADRKIPLVTKMASQ